MSTIKPPVSESTRPTRAIPGPAGAPLLGSLLRLKRGDLDLFLSACRDHGDVVRFNVGPPGLRKVLYGVFSAEGAQQILGTEVTNFRKESRFYYEIRASAGNGLLTSQDADYVRQRRLLQPLFTPRRVDGYGEEIVRETTAMLAAWRDAPGGTVDAISEMTRLTLRMTGRILFGTDFEATLDVVTRCFPYMSDYIRRRSYALVNLPRTWPTPANRRAAAASAEMYAVCDRLIEKRLAEGEPPGAHEMISLLVQARNSQDGRLDASEIRDQVLVFLLASTETTATSLAMAVHLLAVHPQHQQRAREEARRVLGRRVPTAADLDALPYLTNVFKEATRLYPAGPFMSRKATAATEIHGYAIPAGAEVLISPWVTHRHPRYWTDPESFDPDRFTPERERERHRYAWFPFGGGPRACIGRHFSTLESVLALAMVVRDYELTAVDRQVPVHAGITLTTGGPARCRLRAI
jgi:cytochrome P450